MKRVQLYQSSNGPLEGQTSLETYLEVLSVASERMSVKDINNRAKLMEKLEQTDITSEVLDLEDAELETLRGALDGFPWGRASPRLNRIIQAVVAIPAN